MAWARRDGGSSWDTGYGIAALPDGNAEDAQLAFMTVLGTYEPSETERCAADCNGDGQITAGDAQAIFAAVLGMGTCVEALPAEK